MINNVRKKLDFIVVGGAKCGTTSLYNILLQSNYIALPEKKDFHFFDTNDYNSLGFDYYWSLFKSQEALLLGEVSANYVYSELALQRLKSHNKEMKVIYIIRHPAERTVSEYLHQKRNGKIDGQLIDYINSRDITKNSNDMLDKLFRRSNYQYWLGLINKYFDTDSVMVLDIHELNNIESLNNKLSSFLGVEDLCLQKPVASNQSAVTKFRRINNLLKGDNWLKRMLKTVIRSHGLRGRLRVMLRRLNSNEVSSDEVSEMKKLLEAHMSDDIRAYRDILNNEKIRS